MTATAPSNPTLPASPLSAKITAHVAADRDLAELSEDERTEYLLAVCKGAGLNPLTKPLKYIVLDGRLQLYALKNCTDQLRAIHKVSITSLTAHDDGNVRICEAGATTGDGRTDCDVGAVPLLYPATRPGLKGPERHPLANEPLSALDRANAIMTAATKAKRRVMLSLGGLGGILDETEIDEMRAEGRIGDAGAQLTDRSGAGVRPGPVPRARVTPLTLVPKAQADDVFSDDVPTADGPDLPAASSEPSAAADVVPAAEPQAEPELLPDPLTGAVEHTIQVQIGVDPVTRTATVDMPVTVHVAPPAPSIPTASVPAPKDVVARALDRMAAALVTPEQTKAQLDAALSKLGHNLTARPCPDFKSREWKLGEKILHELKVFAKSSLYSRDPDVLANALAAYGEDLGKLHPLHQDRIVAIMTEARKGRTS